MKYETRLVLRVLTAIALFVIPVNVFQMMFSKLTLYASLPILKLLGYTFRVSGDMLFLNGQELEFVPACVATSAFYLLTLLILLTKDIKFKKMVHLFLAGSFLILLLNILRIDLLLIILIEYGDNLFDKVHIIFWHFVSSIYVACVWIFLTYKFRVKNIPVYSDLLYLFKHSKFKKPVKPKRKSRRSRK